MTEYDYSVSARKKNYRQGIEHYLKHNYGDVYEHIKSVFGFVEFNPLYGGRSWDLAKRGQGRELSDDDIHWMYDHNIGFRIPCQNLLAKYEDYVEEKPFFEKYHRDGNILIIAKDDLATWIRNDFPKYKIEASFIKRINTVEKAKATYPLYDTFVPDVAVFGKDYDLLNQLDKDRARLFTNTSCELHCRKRICYTAISKFYIGIPVKDESEMCCHEGIKKDFHFDVDKYKELGFTKFKSMKISSKYNTV